jgi:hypothetical protein
LVKLFCLASPEGPRGEEARWALERETEKRRELPPRQDNQENGRQGRPSTPLRVGCAENREQTGGFVFFRLVKHLGSAVAPVHDVVT